MALSNPSAYPAPPELIPLVDPRNGHCTQVWYRYFLTLFERTGGTIGPNPSTDDLAALSVATDDYTGPNAADQFNALAQLTSDPQAQSIIAYLVAIIGYLTPQDPQQTPWAQIAAAPTPADPFLMPPWVQPQTPQDPNQLVDYLAALAVTTENTTPLAPPEVAVTLGASPAVYRAYYNGTLFLAAGTVTLVEISRDGGATFYDTGVIAGPIPMANGDQVQVTYAVAPTTQVFLPG